MSKRKNDGELIPVEKRKRVIKVEDGRRRRPRRRGTSRLKMAAYLLSILVILLAISVGVTFIMYLANISKIQNMAASAVIELEKVEGGYELRWPSLEEAEADSYFVNVSTNPMVSDGDKRTFFNGEVKGLSCQLPDLPLSGSGGLDLNMKLIKNYSLLGKERTVEISVKRNFSIKDSGIINLDWEVDLEKGIASISFDFRNSDKCTVYVIDSNGGKKPFRVLERENNLELNLNEDEGLWIPTTGNPCIISFVPGYYTTKEENMVVYAGESKVISFTWEDFAARDIHLTLDVLDGCVGRLEWEKVDCDAYEIQMRDNSVGVWKTVKTVSRNDECSYISPRLHPGAGYSFRIAAELDDYVAVSEVLECEIAVTPLYCTIWPVKDLKAYSQANPRSDVAGQVDAMEPLCVVAVENDMFGVDIGGQIGYIDSNYCMINLPEYVGSLCNYDITNSYDSIFMAHGFEIPGLTGEVIKGFEDVQLSDKSFLVPLLYPTARKLEDAIDNAREKGYRLKIYEAFRPHEASVYMYKKASEIQYTTLPESTYWGDDPGVVLTITERDENGASVTRRKTYWELMNDSNNSFNLSAFVSAGISKHNIGVAMDLTLESLETGYEMPMQTDLHDLSQYSARAQNNDYAKELSRIMMSAGYGDLYSEWWHFQDNEARNTLNLPCIDDGVTPECWLSNGVGWRYRQLDGSYAANCTLTIDGREYSFDSDGYCLNYGQN